MKSISVYIFVVALIASALFVSSANAGGRHAGGVSTSATSNSSTVVPVGRSPLGEPVFLIPSNSPQAAQFINGGGRDRIQRVSPARDTPHIMNTSPSIVGRSDDRGTKVVFTPPPTFVGVPPSVTGTGNIAGTNVSADRPFVGNILTTGLGSKGLNPAPDVQQLSVAQPAVIPSVVPIGQGPQGPPTLDRVSTTTALAPVPQIASGGPGPSLTPWVRITPLQYAGPTVEVPTSSATTASH